MLIMRRLRPYLGLGLVLIALSHPLWSKTLKELKGAAMNESLTPIVKTDAEWKKILDPEAYRILRGHGTELACSGQYDHFYEKGVYQCAGCGLTLFASDKKFKSGTGWPSYTAPVAKNRLIEKEDVSFGMRRIEVLCARCGGHLGHVFPDGPAPTRLRYCMNSVALKFVPADSSKK